MARPNDIVIPANGTCTWLACVPTGADIAGASADFKVSGLTLGAAKPRLESIDEVPVDPPDPSEGISTASATALAAVGYKLWAVTFENTGAVDAAGKVVLDYTVV